MPNNSKPAISQHLSILYHLTVNEMRRQYLGTLLGVAWPIVQPVVMAVALLLVFSYGMRISTSEQSTPFSIWLVAGLFPWYYIATNLTGGCQAIVSNAYLVKKVAFELEALPIARVLATLPTHLVLIIGTCFLSAASGVSPSWHWLQLPLYTALLVMFTGGIALATSAVMIFSRDIVNIIAIVTQVGFWLTPVFWDASNAPSKAQSILNFNPAHFIIEGYRDAIFSRNWIWEKPTEALIFTAEAAIFVLVGHYIFTRLRPHFGDVI